MFLKLLSAICFCGGLRCVVVHARPPSNTAVYEVKYQIKREKRVLIRRARARQSVLHENDFIEEEKKKKEENSRGPLEKCTGATSRYFVVFFFFLFKQLAGLTTIFFNVQK